MLEEGADMRRVLGMKSEVVAELEHPEVAALLFNVSRYVTNHTTSTILPRAARIEVMLGVSDMMLKRDVSRTRNSEFTAPAMCAMQYYSHFECLSCECNGETYSTSDPVSAESN